MLKVTRLTPGGAHSWTPALPLFLHEFSEKPLHCAYIVCHTNSSKPHQDNKVFCPSRNLGIPQWTMTGLSYQSEALGSRWMRPSLKSLHVNWKSAASLAVGTITQGHCIPLTGWHLPSTSLKARCGATMLEQVWELRVLADPMLSGMMEKLLMAERSQGRGDFLPAPWELRQNVPRAETCTPPSEFPSF